MKVTYIHRRNLDNKIFYIGSGSVTRPYDKWKRDSKWKEIASNGYSIQVVETHSTTKHAEECEDLLIELVREMPANILINTSTNAENRKKSQIAGGKISGSVQGKRNVKSGHLASIRSSAGKASIKTHGSQMGNGGRAHVGKKWYTNGVKDTMAFTAPSGFYLGRTSNRKDSTCG